MSHIEIVSQDLLWEWTHALEQASAQAKEETKMHSDNWVDDGRLFLQRPTSCILLHNSNTVYNWMFSATGA